MFIFPIVSLKISIFQQKASQNNLFNDVEYFIQQNVDINKKI